MHAAFAHCFAIVVQVSHERAELARQLSQQQAAMEEEQHSRKKMRRKLGKRLEEAERQVVHLQQCLEEKYACSTCCILVLRPLLFSIEHLALHQLMVACSSGQPGIILGFSLN